MYNRRYDRKTVIMRFESNSFSKQSQQTAVATIEIRNGKGKINIQGQNTEGSHAYLIMPKSGENRYVDLGQVGSVFDTYDVGGSGIPIESFDIIVVGRKTLDKDFPESLYVGFIDKKREWKRNLASLRNDGVESAKRMESRKPVLRSDASEAFKEREKISSDNSAKANRAQEKEVSLKKVEKEEEKPISNMRSEEIFLNQPSINIEETMMGIIPPIEEAVPLSEEENEVQESVDEEEQEEVIPSEPVPEVIVPVRGMTGAIRPGALTPAQEDALFAPKDNAVSPILEGATGPVREDIPLEELLEYPNRSWRLGQPLNEEILNEEILNEEILNDEENESAPENNNAAPSDENEILNDSSENPPFLNLRRWGVSPESLDSYIIPDDVREEMLNTPMEQDTLEEPIVKQDSISGLIKKAKELEKYIIGDGPKEGLNDIVKKGNDSTPEMMIKEALQSEDVHAAFRKIVESFNQEMKQISAFSIAELISGMNMSGTKEETLKQAVSDEVSKATGGEKSTINKAEKKEAKVEKPDSVTRLESLEEIERKNISSAAKKKKVEEEKKCYSDVEFYNPSLDVEYIFANNEKMEPFEDKSLEWVRICPEEIWSLPINRFYDVGSSFLISADRMYKHLLLGRTKNGGLMLAVPDCYQAESRKIALNQGFIDFWGIGNNNPEDGLYGYWIKNLL